MVPEHPIARALEPYRGRLPAADLAWMAGELRRIAAAWRALAPGPLK